jgi:hypothetical protein
MTVNNFNSLALSLFNGSAATGTTSSPSGFPGGSIAYYNYLNKSGANLQVQSNKSPAVAKEVAYFQSRVGVLTPAKATSLVKINANLPSTASPGSAQTTTTTVYDSTGVKYTATLSFSKTTTDTWQVSVAKLVSTDGSNTTATINSAPQTITFDTLGNINTVPNFTLGTITLSNGATLAPKFSVSGGGTTAGLLTQRPATSTFTVASVQPDGNPSEAAGSRPIKTVDDLFKDTRLLKFVLTGLGLGDQINNVGLVKKALTEKLFNADGTSKSGTLVSKLNMPKLTDAAQTLDLGDTGLKTLQNPIIVNALIQGYQTNLFEQNIATQDPSVASARYFARNIEHAVSSQATTTNSTFAVLGDSVLRDVVTTALGIPAAGLANLPVEGQAAAIMARVNVNQFKNPAFVSTFVNRYLVQVQNTANQAALQASGQTGLAAFGFNFNTNNGR